MSKKNAAPKDNGKKKRISSARKADFLEMFSRESLSIREAIVKDLPSYNTLLKLEAISFDEFALQLLADKKNIPRMHASSLIPVCPFCGKDAHVGRKEEGIFRCKACSGQTFSPNYNSISSGTKCDALTWMKVLQCLLDFSTITQTCEYCDITETTYYKIRNRLFYAMQLMLDEVKLYDQIQADNTFVRTSYKGMNLSQEDDFPEDSIFFNDTFQPREARKRGQANKMIERGANTVCIFTAIDTNGHVLTRFAGIGATSMRLLRNYIPEDKFLLQVPKKDPFAYFHKKKEETNNTRPGAESKMIADKERAIESYAKSLGIDFEAHVYRDGGVQRRLGEGQSNIQKVNSLHHRLKNFLRKSNYVSTKYLPGYLILFEFLENTGGSVEAINRLFQILATPNLGKPPAFFKDLFTVPNYLLEWIDGDNPVKKLPYSKRLAFYLYDHIRNPQDYPDVNITMEHVMKETGFSAPTIRKNYRDLLEAGYRDKLRQYFGEPSKREKEIEQQKAAQRKKTDAVKTLNPVVLALYDEYVRMLSLPKNQQTKMEDWVQEKNAQYGTSYKRANLLMKFKYIEEQGVRPPRPKREKFIANADGRPPEKVMAIYEDYERARLNAREKGENPQHSIVIMSELSEKYKLSRMTIRDHIRRGQSYMRNKKND